MTCHAPASFTHTLISQWRGKSLDTQRSRGYSVMMIHNAIAWLPLVILPIAAVTATPRAWPAWAFMWLFAFAIYAGCKWLTWWSAPAGATWARQLGYLFAWPGMDATTFLISSSRCKPTFGEWLFALGKIGLGAALLWIAIPQFPVDYLLLRGWVGMVGIIFVLHF